MALVLPTAALDIEVLPNWLYILGTAEDGKVVYEYERWSAQQAREKGELPQRIITFNGARYDLLMVPAILKGLPVEQVVELSNLLIEDEEQFKDAYADHGLKKWKPEYHIDLMKAWIGASEDLKTGLKYRAAILHAMRLPMAPDSFTEPVRDEENAQEFKDYCHDDCMATWHVFEYSRPNLEVFAILPGTKSALERNMPNAAEEMWGGKRKVSKPQHQRGRLYIPKYPAEGIDTPVFDSAWNWAANLLVDEKEPKFNIEPRDFTIGALDYRIGSGGIHTNERCVIHDETLHIDVSSYYPSLIDHIGRDPVGLAGFVKRLQKARQTRLNFKHEMMEIDERYRGLIAAEPERTEELLKNNDRDRNVPETRQRAIKLLINSVSGKIGSPYSKLYDARLYITMTILGQLYLLLLAEMVEAAGYKNRSANTDGIIAEGPRKEIDAICADWCSRVPFELEVEQMVRYAARDVNNYIALETNGKRHVRGCFAVAGKHGTSAQLSAPKGDVIGRAAGDALLKCDNYYDAESLIWDTVTECEDIREFIFARRTKAGAVWKRGGRQLGKTIRWVVAKGGAAIVTTSGSKIPNAEFAVPVYDLRELNLDRVYREWYHRHAMELWGTVKQRGSLL